MAAYSWTTNRGKACAQTAAASGGWRDGAGAAIAAYPAHGNWYYVLILDIVGFADVRDVNTLGDAGITLTPNGNGYAPQPVARNNATVGTVEDDTNKQAVSTFPNASWTASGGAISAKWLALCDGNPFSVAANTVNVIGLLDLDGLQTAPNGQPFNVASIVWKATRPVGEP